MASSIVSSSGASSAARSRHCSGSCASRRWACSRRRRPRSIRSGRSCPRSRAATVATVVDRLLGRPAETAGDGKGDGKGKRDDRSRTGTLDPKDAVWRRVQLARNLARPRTLDLLAEMADEVIELHGDRGFGDDPAIVAGFARIDGRRIAFVGQQRGADTDEKIRRSFGMPHPEGYRKSMRVMEMAERFGLP